MSDPNEIVGHKTFHGGRDPETGLPQFRHEPLTRAEADAIHERVEAAKAKRASDMPTAEDAVRALWQACYRLEELGWKPARLAPADGKTRRTVSIGSSGIHDAFCERRDQHPLSVRTGEKWWWHRSEDGDLWPHEPIYFEPDSPSPTGPAEALPQNDQPSEMIAYANCPKCGVRRPASMVMAWCAMDECPTDIQPTGPEQRK